MEEVQMAKRSTTALLRRINDGIYEQQNLAACKTAFAFSATTC
jgi:hypothetical protein